MSEHLRTRRGRLQTRGATGWRDWNPYRSKLAAWLRASGREWPLAPDARVLYLGAAEGTTVAHVGNLCPQGRVAAIEISPTAMAELLPVAERYRNLLPVLAEDTDVIVAQSGRDGWSKVAPGRRALPISPEGVGLMTQLFEIARYSGVKPQVVDEFGMTWSDGSYNLWCGEALETLHTIELDLEGGLEQGFLSRMGRKFRRWAT